MPRVGKRSPAPVTLSVCIIARDEEPNIGRAIDSVRDVALEVIVLDTGSTDRTVDIARQKGARVDFFAWTADFSEARNRANALAKGDWILSLDADEAVTDEFRRGWADAARSTQADGLSLPLRNVGAEDLIVVRLTRLFRNRRGYAFEGRIHEDIGGSIVRSGKTVAPADLSLLHYGYTPAEDARKQRGERNREMLRALHEADPKNPRHWHYLALEHAKLDEHDAALPLLNRLIAEQPSHILAGWSAAVLSEILYARGAVALAWTAARFASKRESGKVTGTILMGAIALADGDPTTAEWCAEQLLRMDSGHIDVDHRPATATHFRAGAMWELGHRELAIAKWLQGVRAFPMNLSIADQYVRHLGEFRGGARGVIEAMRTVASQPVAAGAAAYFLRAGDWERAGQLAAACKVPTPETAHALFRMGNLDEALAVVAETGLRGRLAGLLWALEKHDDGLAARLLAGARATRRTVAACVQRGERVPASLDWMVWNWARTCLDLRCDDLVRRLVDAAHGSAVERGARCATLFLEANRPAEALRYAAENIESPNASGVIGLIAHDHADFRTAAEFLSKRAEAGDAPVRVYRQGAHALRSLGRAEDAQHLLALGKEARPDSLFWDKEGV